MPASKYIEPDGRFKPIDGSRFEGCVKAQMATGLNEEDARELCAYIGRKAGKIKGSAECSTLEDGEGVKLAETSEGYKFSENDDGTFSVFDVPLMAEVEAGAKQNRKKISKAWMLAAVAKAVKRFDEDGYKAPLHIEHHGQGQTEPAGFVVPREVRRFDYEGRPVWAIFGELQVTPKVLERIRGNSLPYRSVEVFDWKIPELASCALLSSEVPYFRFPVLTLGKQIGETQKFTKAGPAKASRQFALGAAVLFSFTGGKMPEPTAQELDANPDDAILPVDPSKSPEKFEMDDAEARELAEVHARVHEGYEILKRIARKLGVDEEDDKEDREDVEVAEAVEAPVEASAAFAAIQGKVNALEARERKRKDEAERDEVVETAMVSLSAWSPDDATRDSLIKLVACSRAPQETAEAFVESFRSTVPMRPSSTLEAFDARMRLTPDDEAVAKFAEHGPDALADARDASSKFDELAARGLLLASSREDFIKTTMGAKDHGAFDFRR